MNTEPITNRCPKCQGPLPANAPQGLCPKCLLAAASTPTEAGQPLENNPPPPIEAVKAAFPQLQILEVIGQGGMGVVYKARQPHLDRFVALKVLSQSLAADATFAERFNREARVLARLNHPNIVTVHDFGQSGGFFYLLMEYVDGVNLRQAMQAGRFTPQQAMMLVPKICEALQFAHDEGILHRDIKPANILLDTRGRVKIADFGIAKLLGEAREKVTLTASGMTVGTPHYMAPEQLEHPQDVDQRADIYSLGVVFYEMLTGELPIGRFAPPSQKAAVDARVDDVVFHALEREREKRFRSAGEVKTRVEAITAQISLQPGQTVTLAAPAAPGVAPSAPELRVPCYFNTPARMRDCFPSAAVRIFTCKGELALDRENLTFTSLWRTTITIPLKAITDLSVGQFQMWTTPWVMKYARISFLAVTFRQQGQLQAVHLTPVEPGAVNASQINDGVGRWFERVRQAVIQCTGTTPQTSDTASVSVSAEPAWNRKVLPLVIGCLAMGIGTWVLQARMVQGPIWVVSFVLILLLVMGLGWFSVTFLRANSALGHGDLDAVTSDDPPAPEPASPSAGSGVHHRQAARWARTSFWTITIFALAVVLLLTWLSYKGRYIPPSAGGAPGGATAAGVASAPDLASQFVLYTMPILRHPSPLAIERQAARNALSEALTRFTEQHPAVQALKAREADLEQRLAQEKAAAGVAPANQLGEWHFKCLVPAQHMARILFVRWSNSVPVVEIAGSAHYQVGKKSMDQDLSASCEPFPDHGPTNTVYWSLSLYDHNGAGMYVPRGPAYRRLDTPTRLTVRSGYQGILRLVDYVTPEGEPMGGHSGIELRIFLEPMKYAPVRVDPFEVQGPDYVAGSGPGWTIDQALKAIKEWPVDK
jgi:tRNA A-37 threonylcarbamoyl transferase component Bud32